MVVMQAVLLFGSKTWVLTPHLEKALEVFHHRAERQMAGIGPKCQQDGTWVYPAIGGTRGDQGLYRLPSEHSHTINCNPSYHGLVFGSGAESGNAPIQGMVGASRPGYHGKKGGTYSHGGGGEETEVE